MRRVLGTAFLVAAMFLLQGGAAPPAGADEGSAKHSVVTGCVCDLAALGGGNALRVKIVLPDRKPSRWASAPDERVAAILRTAFDRGQQVTILRRRGANGRWVVKGAWLNALAPECERLLREVQLPDPPPPGKATESDAVLRLLPYPCVWPDGAGEPRRPSQMLEEIKVWAWSDLAEHASLRDDIIDAAKDVENFQAPDVFLGWHWLHFQLRAAWGKASQMRERRMVPPDPAIQPQIDVPAEWGEVHVALLSIVGLTTPAPVGVHLPPPTTLPWPYEPLPFESPAALLQSLVDLATAAHEAEEPRLSQQGYFDLLTNVGRCQDPGLLRSLPDPHPVCDLLWPWPYRHLVGIWGKAVHAEVQSDHSTAAAEWLEVLAAIDSFPDEIEDPGRGK